MNNRRAGIAIGVGEEIAAHGKRYVITHVLDMESVLARDPETGTTERLAFQELTKCPDDSLSDTVSAAHLPDIENDDWDTAKRRLTLITPLFHAERRTTRSEIERAASEYGVEASTVYRWMRIYESSGRKTSSLLPQKRDGGRGKSRLAADVDGIIQVAIDEYYLRKSQPSVRATADEVARLCRASGLAPPHANTVRNRIRQITERERLKRRAHAKDASDRYEPRPGEFDAATHPLGVVQIDHTPLNIILVDEEERRPVGRPWLTLACDVYSRMIVGFYISLDPPGAASVGLCLTHAILPKEIWLAKRGIDNSWPCWGLPAIVHCDNGRDFHGKMLQRACEEHHIELDFRILARPHYGAHIERLMGTISTAVETLEGATFSSPKQRGEYDSDARAAMTLSEFERWFAEYVTGVYHKRLHFGINTTPEQRWRDGILGTKANPAPRGIPNRPTAEDEHRLRLDFMPYVERSIQQYGVQIDDIFYYSDVLRPYIGLKSRNGPRKYVFKRDPRDISVVYFFDPNLKQYAEMPYRNSAQPAMSVWELRAIKKQLLDEGRTQVDENAIFDSYQRLRAQQQEAAVTTKRIRRERERRKGHAGRERPALPKPPVPDILNPPDSVKPFDILDV